LRHVEYKTGIICEYVCCLKTLSNFKFTQGLYESKKYEYGALTNWYWNIETLWDNLYSWFRAS